MGQNVHSILCLTILYGYDSYVTVSCWSSSASRYAHVECARCCMTDIRTPRIAIENVRDKKPDDNITTALSIIYMNRFSFQFLLIYRVRQVKRDRKVIWASQPSMYSKQLRYFQCSLNVIFICIRLFAASWDSFSRVACNVFESVTYRHWTANWLHKTAINYYFVWCVKSMKQ